MQMNPNLRGGQSTEDLMKQVNTTLKTSPAPAPVQAPAANAPKSAVSTKVQPQGDVFDTIIGAKTEFEREMQRNVDTMIRALVTEA